MLFLLTFKSLSFSLTPRLPLHQYRGSMPARTILEICRSAPTALTAFRFTLTITCLLQPSEPSILFRGDEIMKIQLMGH